MLAQDGANAASGSLLSLHPCLPHISGSPGSGLPPLPEHVIERLPDGKFNQDDARLKYLAWLRDPARRSARSQADADFVRAKTQLLELRVGERRGTLIPKERVDANCTRRDRDDQSRGLGSTLHARPQN
jgi:hypothetical protein